MSTVRSKRRRKNISTKQNVLSERVEHLLELPLGTLSNAARIEFMGNKKVVLDGCIGIVEYSDDIIRMQTGSGILRFSGRSLSISCLTEDSAIIEGNILSLEFLS